MTTNNNIINMLNWTFCDKTPEEQHELAPRIMADLRMLKENWDRAVELKDRSPEDMAVYNAYDALYKLSGIRLGASLFTS